MLLVASLTGCGESSEFGEATAQVTGSVYLEPGVPCSGCSVTLSSPVASVQDVAQITGEDGSYNWDRLYPVEYTVHAWNGVDEATATIVLDPQTIKHMDIYFSDGAN